MAIPSHPTLVYITRLLHGLGYASVLAYLLALIVVRPLLANKARLLSYYHKTVLSSLQRLTKATLKQFDIIPSVCVRYKGSDVKYLDACVEVTRADTFFRLDEEREATATLTSIEKLADKLDLLTSVYQKSAYTGKISGLRVSAIECCDSIRASNFSNVGDDRASEISETIRQMKSDAL